MLEEALEEFYILPTQHTNILLLVCELSYNIEWQGSCVFYFNFLPSQRKLSNRVWWRPILSNHMPFYKNLPASGVFDSSYRIFGGCSNLRRTFKNFAASFQHFHPKEWKSGVKSIPTTGTIFMLLILSAERCGLQGTVSVHGIS